MGAKTHFSNYYEVVIKNEKWTRSCLTPENKSRHNGMKIRQHLNLRRRAMKLTRKIAFQG